MILLQTPITQSDVSELLEKGSRFIAPLWSLENFVAVNAYMGMSDMSFADAMSFLDKSAKTEGTLPSSFYLDALKKGRLSKRDISKALANNEFGISEDVDDFIVDLYKDKENTSPSSRTLSDVANEIQGKKWSRFMVDRISFWGSAYFDSKQAVWDTASNDVSLFAAWKREAEIDRAPEVMGLKGFRKFVASLPNNYLDAAALALNELEIPKEMYDYYINSLLMKMNGWAGFTARIDWDARLKGKESHALQEFLTILLVWELSFIKLLDYTELEYRWTHSKSETLAMLSIGYVNEDLAQRLILQEAFDLANQRSIIRKINDQELNQKEEKKRPTFQAIFCIDVRSEIYRRNLEAVNSEVETLGFAGFFAFPIKYVPLGYNDGTDQCPVLLDTSHTIKEQMHHSIDGNKVIKKRALKTHISKAIKSFKQGAISCFGFVSPLGLFFLPKLLSDSFGKTRSVSLPGRLGLNKKEVDEKDISLEFHNLSEPIGIPFKERVKMATTTLKGMSLTENFAPVVLIVGHGSSTTNNPHASGLDCGACGGNSGESNARVAAAVLNEAQVRQELRQEGILIPQTTIFIAALHNTTTDEVTLFDTSKNDKTDWQNENIKELKYSLQLAGEKSRIERAERMHINEKHSQKGIIERSKDWSQVRPEWGLAGCSSFIVAPRERTSQLNFGGKSFMHNYTWENDKDFSVLELIMTAPMVVTSWINLQYYASAVDNKKFGSGNKTLHNVVGGVGVLEGFAGDLRVGLPLQSVHDGEKFQHEPQRLNVIIEAPVDEMSKILEKHDSIRNLCDNNWIYLFAINNNGKVKYKYIGNLEWEVI